jgi:hypothetical protein
MHVHSTISGSRVELRSGGGGAHPICKARRFLTKGALLQQTPSLFLMHDGAARPIAFLVFFLSVIELPKAM